MYSYLRTKNLSAELYAFPCAYAGCVSDMTEFNARHLTAVLTLCACTPPLDEVLQLWDFLLAFGVHLNVLCVIAQLLLMREAVMESSRYVLSPWTAVWFLTTFIFSSPMRILRTFPPLQAQSVIGIAVTLVRDLPADLYDELVRHPYAVPERSER